jgi:hypothetical protein
MCGARCVPFENTCRYQLLLKQNKRRFWHGAFLALQNYDSILFMGEHLSFSRMRSKSIAQQDMRTLCALFILYSSTKTRVRAPNVL